MLAEKERSHLDFGAISTSADDDIYQLIGHRYIAHTNRTGEQCSNAFASEGYVTRGADWYQIIGGMQDYGYLNYGTIELTMEISCCKYPQSATLVDYWNFNRDAMIDMLLQAQRGAFTNARENSERHENIFDGFRSERTSFQSKRSTDHLSDRDDR